MSVSASSVGKDSNEGPESFEAAAVFFGKVVEELNKLINLAIEHENVFKSKFSLSFRVPCTYI